MDIVQQVSRYTSPRLHNIDPSMPAPVKAFPEDSLEHKAYLAVEDVPTVEFNDRNRLGYHVFLYLSRTIDTLTEAVHVAQARTSLSEQETVQRISGKLSEMGVALP